MTDISKGGYTVTRSEYGGGEVYKNGEIIGNYWEDKWGGYAVFRAGVSKPIARLKTEAGCIRKLTDGEMTGTDLRRALSEPGSPVPPAEMGGVVRIDATGMSAEDGDRLRDLLARFAERANETGEVYQQARDDRADPGILAIRRARWKAWTAAYDMLVRGFHWSTVPSTVPREIRQRSAVGPRGSVAELRALMKRTRKRRHGRGRGVAPAPRE